MSKLRWFVALVTAYAALTSGLSFAQTKEEFKITSFIPEKFKDLEWTVDGNAALAGSKSKNSSWQSSPSYWDQARSHSNELVLDLIGRTWPTYNWYSRKQSIRVDLPLDLRYLNNSYDSYNTTANPSYLGASEQHKGYSRLRVRLSPTVKFQEYSFGDWFSSLDATGQLMYDYDPNSYDTRDGHRSSRFVGWLAEREDVYRKTETSTTARNNWVRGVVSVGFGRIYSGYYAATAIYFCNELRRRGLLRHEFDFDQMLALTEMIYQRRLLHAVDSREFQIETYQMLLDYAQSEGLVDSSNTASLVLQDVWRSFPGDARDFGWQVSFGRGFEFRYSSQQSTTSEAYRLLRIRYQNDSLDVVDTLSYTNTKSARTFHAKSTNELQYMVLRTAFSRPLSLKWQFDGQAEGRAYLNWTSDPYSDGSKHKTSGKYALDIDALLRCFFSSRSSASFEGTIVYERKVESLIDRDGNEVSAFEPSAASWSLGSRLDLRVSMPTTLSIGASVASHTNETEYSTAYSYNSGLQYSVSVGLSHHIY